MTISRGRGGGSEIKGRGLRVLPPKKRGPIHPKTPQYQKHTRLSRGVGLRGVRNGAPGGWTGGGGSHAPGSTTEHLADAPFGKARDPGTKPRICVFLLFVCSPLPPLFSFLSWFTVVFPTLSGFGCAQTSVGLPRALYLFAEIHVRAWLCGVAVSIDEYHVNPPIDGSFPSHRAVFQTPSKPPPNHSPPRGVRSCPLPTMIPKHFVFCQKPGWDSFVTCNFLSPLLIPRKCIVILFDFIAYLHVIPCTPPK